MSQEIIGLPEFGKKTDLPKVGLSEKVDMDFVLQEHDAHRAGKHFDLRLSDGDTAFSWAVKKGLPTPGNMHLAIRQSDHSPDYMGYTGTIASGYGKGEVSTKRGIEKVFINKSDKDKIKFTFSSKQDPEEYVLFNPSKFAEKDDWLISNVTPTRNMVKYDDVPDAKPVYKNKSADRVEEVYSDDSIFTNKIDGAHIITKFSAGDIPKLFSYRKSQKSGRLINHTYKVPGNEVINVPKELDGTIARGEVYGEYKGKSIPASKLGGILNSSIDNALKKLEDNKVDMKIMLFDLIKYKGKDVRNEKYEDRLKMLEEVNKKLPDIYHLPDIAKDKRSQKRLFEKIKSGKHNKTKEGVMVWGKDQRDDRPTKIKIRPDYDVHIREFFEGNGRLAGKGVGGFSYSLTPNGEILGRVGTGFSDKLRKEMRDNPDKFIGRVARVNALDQFPRGVLRAPAFKDFHLEKGKMEKESKINLKAFFRGFANELIKQSSMSYTKEPKELGFFEDIMGRISRVGDSSNRKNDSLWNPLNWTPAHGIDAYTSTISNPAASGGVGAALGGLASVLYDPDKIGWHNLIGALAGGAGGAALSQFYGKPKYSKHFK